MRHTVWMRALGMVAICWIGHIPAQWLRHFIYRRVFRVKLAVDAVIYRRCEIWAPSQLDVGARGRLWGRIASWTPAWGSPLGKMWQSARGL
jgi:hypothetical protein